MPATKTTKGGTVWSDEERAAMQQAARERRKASRLSPEEERAEGERAVLEKIAEMPEPDRGMATRIHELVTSAVPTLVPRTYYGMPAYAADGKTICFFKPASKFKERYATFGFEANARIDDGPMWPTSYAVLEITPEVESRIVDLVKRAVR